MDFCDIVNDYKLNLVHLMSKICKVSASIIDIIITIKY